MPSMERIPINTKPFNAFGLSWSVKCVLVEKMAIIDGMSNRKKAKEDTSMAFRLESLYFIVFTLIAYRSVAINIAAICVQFPVNATWLPEYMRRNIPIVPINIPIICDLPSLFPKTMKPMITVKIGVKLLSIPANPDVNPVWANGNKKAGIKFPETPTIRTPDSIFLSFIFFNALKAKGLKTNAAISILRAPTCSKEKIFSLFEVYIPLFIRMNELPQIRESRMSKIQFLNSLNIFLGKSSN